jgi:SAM-dependent methyltransferase
MFVSFNLDKRPSYRSVLDDLKTNRGAKHLDIGCCVGQDIRKLVVDGVRSSQITAIELEPQFVELGYQLFLDKDRLQTRFFTANILTDDEVVKELEGQMSSVHMNLVLHLFTRDEQKKVLGNVLRILAPGGILLGSTVANEDGIEQSLLGKMTMRHNLRTWSALIQELQTEMGLTLTTWEEMIDFPLELKRPWREDAKRIMAFEVVKV